MEFSGLLSQIITIVSGLLFTGISALGAFYIKRLIDTAKKKTLLNEIDRYVLWADQAESFKVLSGKEKAQAVLEKARQFAEENGITVGDNELSLMVERSVQSLRSLSNIGMRLSQSKKL
jgi:hypothetical protein